MKRIISLDLLKIIAVIMVIILHYLNNNFGNGLIWNNTKIGITTHFFESLCIVAVNVFVIITGYFSVHKDAISIKKIYKIAEILIFYGIIVFVGYLIIHKPSFNINLIYLALDTTFNRWFILQYMALCIFMPYINYTLRKVSKKQFQLLLFACTFFFSVWPTYFSKITLYDAGYGIVTLTQMYLIGAYIKHYKDSIYKYKCLLYFLGIMSLALTTIFYDTRYTWSYCSPLVIMQAMALFIFFDNIKIKNNKQIGKYISKLASCSLAVYIIHENHIICKWLYQDVFLSKNYVGTWGYIPNMVISTISIFIICSLIELLRQWIFKKTINKYTDKWAILNKNLTIKS